MRKMRGFKLGKRIFRVANWIFGSRRRRNRSLYRRLTSEEGSSSATPITKLVRWGRRLMTSGARSLCWAKSGYLPAAVPKGHLAVYVGGNDAGDFHRVLVPVIYVNHPLFGNLLRDAEEEYGFDQEGGIVIPCPFAEFERVKTRIDAVSGGGGRRQPKLHRLKRSH
ncbi:unnamed protein product [Linum tenue]|uniref:Uncharacterized protein n=1 Tax=Linum tenue TaxID=586396 RepID=A0AAV0S4J0_9ROSI|nr:unnamed protein product [Linum tenue]